MYKHKGFIKIFTLLSFMGVFTLHPLSVAAITYQPGETLDPACLPTDVDCTVATSTTSLPTLSVIGGSASTVTLGNNVGAATTTIQSGTGGIILEAAGTSSAGNIQIGAGGSGSATPDLLLLDTKNTAGDPTGVRGAMYYNSNTHVFRCFEFSVWRDCETGPRTATLDDSTSDTLTTTEAELIDGTAPSIDPRVAGNRIWVTGFIRLTPAGGDAETDTFRIRRGSGVCTGTQVGSDITIATTMTGVSPIAVINVIDSPATISAQTYTLCGLSSTATSPNTIPHIVLTITEIAAAGADLAELYSTTDRSIESGDVVAIDPQVEKGVLKTLGAADPLAIGIVSTMPGLLMNDGVEGNHLVQVSLAGRVPVKVNLENGAIEPGDYLTSSSEPGVAMKTSGVGPVIAQALSSYDGEGVGIVLAFVKNFDSGANTSLLGDISSSSADSATIQSELSRNPVTVIAQKVADGVHFLTDFVVARVTAIRGYFDELFARKVHTDELCLKKKDGTEVCVNGEQLQAAILSASSSEDDSPSAEDASAPAEDPAPAEAPATSETDTSATASTTETSEVPPPPSDVVESTI